jgi:metallo-beta-lactamase family protein
VKAEIVKMGQLSAHAGQSELLRWLAALQAVPKQTYLTHGEPVAANALQGAIAAKFPWKATVAKYLETIEI